MMNDCNTLTESTRKNAKRNISNPVETRAPVSYYMTQALVHKGEMRRIEMNFYKV